MCPYIHIDFLYPSGITFVFYDMRSTVLAPFEIELSISFPEWRIKEGLFLRARKWMFEVN